LKKRGERLENSLRLHGVIRKISSQDLEEEPGEDSKALESSE
jgi:hypothetical protein